MPGDERLAVERHLREFDRLGDDLKVIERDLARSALADEAGQVVAYHLTPALLRVLDDTTWSFQRLEAIGELISHRGGDDDFLGAAQVPQPSGQIDAVAVEVDVVGQHVGEINAHSQADSLIGR